MKLPSSITLCEVGLRDGLQNEATLLTVRQKVALLLGLIDAGFKVIEVGSFMHSKAVPQMANTDEVYKSDRRYSRRGTPRPDPESSRNHPYH